VRGVKSIDVPSGDIVFIDEFDQIRTSGPAFKDVRLGVQRGLLKMLELTAPPKGGFNRPQQPRIPFDTTEVIFVCCGDFVGFEDIIAKSLGGGGFGFAQMSENYQVGVDGFAGRSSVPPRSWHEICYASWQCGLRMGIDGACHNFLEEANKATIDSRWFCGKPRNRVRAE
jgi:AAA domain (Cdc48 subfamily)